MNIFLSNSFKIYFWCSKEPVLLSTHNICFDLERRKKYSTMHPYKRPDHGILQKTEKMSAFCILHRNIYKLPHGISEHKANAFSTTFVICYIYCTPYCYSKTGTSLLYLSLHHTKLDSATRAAVRILPFWGFLRRKHCVSFLQCWKSIAWNTRQVIWAMTCDLQQFDILTSVDSDEPVQPPFKLRNSKWCSVSCLTIIRYSSD